MIQFGEDQYKTALQTLWAYCFPNDTSRFTKFYFDKIYQNDETLICLENNQPVAALQMIPYSIKTGETIRPGAYLSGIMTHPAYRKRGYMNQLLQAAFDAMEGKGYDYTFLIPQEEWLIQVYAKYNFKLCLQEAKVGKRSPEKSSAVLRFEAKRSVPDTVLAAYNRFLREKEAVVLKNETQFAFILQDFFDEKGILFANDQGLAFTLNQSGQIILQEFLYPNETVKEQFLKEIRQYYRLNPLVFPNENKGMIKKLNPSAEEISNLYLGMMLD